jgi:hypothetical protein
MLIQFQLENNIDLFFIDNSHSVSLKGWAETRWDSRWSSIDSIKQNYKTLVVCFQELEIEGTDRSVDARGLLLAIKEPMFIVALFILHRVLGIIKVLSDQLKGINSTNNVSFFKNLSFFPQQNRWTLVEQNI